MIRRLQTILLLLWNKAKVQTSGTTITSPQCLEILILRVEMALNYHN